jgi:hypothetical protein
LTRHAADRRTRAPAYPGQTSHTPAGARRTIILFRREGKSRLVPGP